MPDERDEEMASVDSAMERELEHEGTRSAKHKQDEIEKNTRDHHLDD